MGKGYSAGHGGTCEVIGEGERRAWPGEEGTYIIPITVN